MKLSTSALVALLSMSATCMNSNSVEAFVAPHAATVGASARTGTRIDMAGGEFDHLLGEKTSDFVSNVEGQPSRARTVLRVPDGSDLVTLTSSVAADPSATGEQFYDAVEDTLDLDDPFASESAGAGANGADGTSSSSAIIDDPRVRELVAKKQQKFTFQPMKYVEGKDFTDLFFTVFLPVGLAAYGAKWALGRSSTYLSDTADFKLEDYANEMVYHDGDMEEMEMCHKDYTTKLGWLGPNKKDRMIKAYLEAFAKKVSVSPKSISSLSYAFSLYKLSEDKAAQALAETATSNPERTASNQKLLFFGNHILKSPEAKAKLQPIRDMLTESYRDDVGISGEEILEKSQQAMGEAAYRAAINSGGKKQSNLTPGWEVLGLTKETATQIFEEEKDSGFVSEKEAKYGRTAAKYDEKGRRLDKEGNVEDDNGVGEDDDDAEESTSNVYECGECGYTIFVAEGRNHKFFGAGFKCPECGAEKDKFVGRTAGED